MPIARSRLATRRFPSAIRLAIMTAEAWFCIRWRIWVSPSTSCWLRPLASSTFTTAVVGTVPLQMRDSATAAPSLPATSSCSSCSCRHMYRRCPRASRSPQAWPSNTADLSSAKTSGGSCQAQGSYAPSSIDHRVPFSCRCCSVVAYCRRGRCSRTLIAVEDH